MKRFKKIFWRFTSDQRGMALVLVAAGMVAFTGFMALVADVGLLALNKQRLVNAVDAAALAGVHELPVNPDQAKAVAVNYALQNGANPLEPQVGEYLGDPNTKLTVSAARQVEFAFARVLGINSGTVSATATAGLSGIRALNGAAPLAVPDKPFEFGASYTLKVGANSEDPPPLGPGTFGALSLGGNGASNYEDNLKYGYSGQLKVGDVVNTETGNMSNPTKRAVDYRMDLCTHTPACTPAHFDPGCPRILFIPVYRENYEAGGQIKNITISGFAAFLVDRVTGQGTQSYIEGAFIRLVIDGETSPGQTDYGLQGAKLIE
ncbi:hypothetical protein Psch_00535 [Pelotomaculum schinkii]|uniref:Putative Flp pilus-assembly TadG-like N-terminal domain-containing protein n=1 Tax=Pelotomaculum schinkii TaxID=78350 RepID=A0A4Y7RF97_9FIRM|nr:pilus assembly protein TadG-related protein [Pelotomaculum schinkii]TEB06997.1 hypothetical protein Psch_00535 [Pelotomaculum schinkii]